MLSSCCCCWRCRGLEEDAMVEAAAAVLDWREVVCVAEGMQRCCC